MSTTPSEYSHHHHHQQHQRKDLAVHTVNGSESETVPVQVSIKGNVSSGSYSQQYVQQSSFRLCTTAMSSFRQPTTPQPENSAKSKNYAKLMRKIALKLR